MQNNNGKDQGFTLVELLVSIVILVLISIPLMNGFTTASISSRRAKTQQKATMLAQNLVECIKGQGMSDFINNMSRKDYAKLHLDSPYAIPNDIESIQYNDVDGIYEFWIKKVKDGDKEFDVFVKIDPSLYKTDTAYAKTVLKPKQNIYNMPKIENLQSDKIVVIDAKGYGMEWEDVLNDGNYTKKPGTYLDIDALNYFKGLQDSYISAKRAENPSLIITPYEDSYFINHMEKKTIIEVSNREVGGVPDETCVILTATIQYYISGSWAITDDVGGLHYDRSIVSTVLTSDDGTNPLEHIYILYNKTAASDKIVLKNSTKKINNPTWKLTEVAIIASPSLDVTLDYTDVEHSFNLSSNAIITGASNEIVKKLNPMNRIYSIEVEVYDSTDIYKSGKKYCKLESTKGE